MIDLDPAGQNQLVSQRRLERRPVSRDELLAPQSEARVLRQAEVERPRNAERPLGMA